MMNIVAGFVQPTQGRVLLDGKPIARPGPDRGVIFQEYGVFPWLTVQAEHRVRPEARGQPRGTPPSATRSATRYMDLMGLTDFADALAEDAVGRHAPAPGARARLRGASRSSC